MCSNLVSVSYYLCGNLVKLLNFPKLWFFSSVIIFKSLWRGLNKCLSKLSKLIMPTRPLEVIHFSLSLSTCLSQAIDHQFQSVSKTYLNIHLCPLLLPLSKYNTKTYFNMSMTNVVTFQKYKSDDIFLSSLAHFFNCALFPTKVMPDSSESDICSLSLN